LSLDLKIPFISLKTHTHKERERGEKMRRKNPKEKWDEKWLHAFWSKHMRPTDAEV
jgi:hypothetical protein